MQWTDFQKKRIHWGAVGSGRSAGFDSSGHGLTFKSESCDWVVCFIEFHALFILASVMKSILEG